MRTVTFDWNCVISAENDDANARHIRKLVDLHRKGRVEVALTTVSASENLSGSQEFPASGEAFFSRIRNLGWDDLKIELAPAVIGLTFFDACKLIGDEEVFESEIDAIWRVIGGEVDHQLPEGLTTEELWSRRWKRWRNVWCDVYTLWTHIDADRDVFVTTNTRDFQDKFTQLSVLGLRGVKTPSEMVAELTQ